MRFPKAHSTIWEFVRLCGLVGDGVLAFIVVVVVGEAEEGV